MLSVRTKPTLPRWLCETVLLGTLPWEQGLCLPYSHFNHIYTLHDSYLLGTYQSAETYGESILCFLWDTLWLPEAVHRQVCPDTPVFLLMKTTNTLGIALSEETSSKPDKHPRRILKVEHVEVDDQTVLVIDDTRQNTMTVVFSGQLHVLAIDSNQCCLNLDLGACG